ncbi:MAG: LPS export ABC transporter periplasmic protein LptC [Niabella sp.]
MKKFFTYLLLLGFVALTSCENSDQEISALNKKATMRDEASKIEGFLSQGGKMKARLTAPIMIRVTADTSYTEFPKSLHVDFYNDLKEVESRLDSKYGKYYESLNKVYLRDSVRVITIKGDTLLCRDLWWDQDQRKFYTNKQARYWSKTRWNIGENGLEATQDLSTVTFFNNTGKMLTEGDGFTPAKQTP